MAIGHAGKAIEQAIACGRMLLEAKAKVPHGKWLPWLRDNITFSLRAALHALATPRRDAIDADLEAWIAGVHVLNAIGRGYGYQEPCKK